MNRRILISGGEGNLNKQLRKCNENYVLHIPTQLEMDITKIDEVERVIKEFSPTHIIHTAAITRPMSIHEQNPAISIQTNIVGTSNIALMCLKYKIKLIYTSTDYVYNGVKGDYKETDGVNPFTSYGWSKLGGECSVKMCPNHLILRLAMCERPFPHPKALVDMVKSPIYVDQVANIILKLIDEVGVINIGGKAQSVFDFVKQDNPNIDKITLSEIGDVSMAKNCSMNIDKLKTLMDND
ncbi:sugar nucleotide-binding protein [bacterium]|jgi:dTDP-4-dehydrorhamnose reductase|nr:sugar nucleotide-binding protein [bacterium]|tara:strand:+ start:2456 stop:3172 length:717 start_codon:yes stop_codon:yes gene_type:complete